MGLDFCRDIRMAGTEFGVAVKVGGGVMMWFRHTLGSLAIVLSILCQCFLIN